MNLFFLSGVGRLSSASLKRMFGLWLIAEILAFALAVKLLGIGGTLLLMFATSVLGIALLKRAGTEAARRLGRMMASGEREGAFVDGTLAALGAFLLILPGFVSDLVGVMLTAPSLRQAIAARFVSGSGGDPRETVVRRHRSDVIDLSPDDWRVVDRTERGF